MNDAADKLNRLLEAEYAGPSPRLREASPFVSAASAADRAVLDRLIAGEADHERMLVEMILTLRGAPAPRRYATDSGGDHFLELSYLMPAVVAAQRGLVRACQTLGPTGDPRADALVARLLDDHRRNLADLERLHAGLAAAAPAR